MAALDLSRQYEILKLIQDLAQQKITIILTTHLPDHALMLPTTIGLLDSKGSMVTGSCEELVEHDRSFLAVQLTLTLHMIQ